MADFLKSLLVKGIEIDTAGAVTGDVLKFDGTKFGAASAGGGGGSSVGALDDLSDVVITSPEEFQGISYNGTSWVNSHIPLVSYVRNAESTTLTTGTVVYLFGATGDHATVKRADKSSDTTSSKTIGVAGANITASNNGPIVTRGYVDGIDLSVGYTAGDILWLGDDGAFTKTKATAPDHLVFVGVVVRATNNGIIYVACQNGYELDELHNVSLPSPNSGDFLKYNGSLWVADAIDLGTDTTGNYVAGITAGTGVTVTGSGSEGATPTISVSVALDELSDVILTSSTNGDFLKYNSGSWVNDPINLGTDTVGNYMSGVSAGTGISVTHTPSEGSTATISLSNSSITLNGSSISLTSAGSQTVSVNANDLTGTTLASAVVSSSLTSVGTITTGTWNGTTIAVANGGTGATDAPTARTNLGIAIGTDVQAYDPELAALAGLTSAANKLPYFTGSGTASTTDFTSTARTLLDDASTSDMRTTLGLAIGVDVQEYNSTLAAVAAGTYTGDDSITTVGTISSGIWNGTTIAVANGGTGATDSGTARTNLGVGTADSPSFAGVTADNIQVGVTGANEIDTSSGNLTIDSAGGTTTLDDNVIVSGDLQVNGTTITVNSTTITVDDPIITLGGDTAPGADDNKDRGVEFRWHNGTSAKVGFFGFDDSTGKLTFIPDATNSSEVFSGTLGTIDVGDIHINGSQIAASNLSNGTTGSGSIVLSTSPTLSTSVFITDTATTINSASSTSIDTTAVSGTEAVEYTIRLTQGSKRRVSKVLAHLNNGNTDVDYVEYAVIETGGAMAGVSIAAAVSGSDITLNATVTDAGSTNVTAKVIKVVMQ